MRAARPEIAAQAARWGVAGAGAWIALAMHREELSLAGGLLWWGSVWKMLDWHLGMAEAGDGTPRERLARADAVTLVRFWLVPALRDAEHLPHVVALAGASDWLDGRLARRRGNTRLGRDLDTTADLLFSSYAALIAYRAGRLGAVGSSALAARNCTGLGISLLAALGRARQPAMSARRWGAALRFAGLLIALGGAPPERRAGEWLLLAGCVVPPRSIALRRFARVGSRQER